MDAVLLDTNVFSYLLKPGDPRADLYRPHVTGKTPAVSFVTVGELYAGALRRSWGQKKISELEYRLRHVIIVPYDVEVCRAYARMANLKTSSGSDRIIPANDRWIAACAIRHEVPLVSHNRRDFQNIPGLVLITEAEVQPEPAPQTLSFGDGDQPEPPNRKIDLEDE